MAQLGRTWAFGASHRTNARLSAEGFVPINLSGHTVSALADVAWEILPVRMERCDSWRCSNPDCGCEILVIVGARFASQSNPTCVCGAAMKKPYRKPEIRKADGNETGRLKKAYAFEVS